MCMPEQCHKWPLLNAQGHACQGHVTLVEIGSCGVCHGSMFNAIVVATRVCLS